MPTKAFAGIYFIWIVLFIFASAMDNLLVAPGRETLLNSIMSGQIEGIQGAGIFAIPAIAVGMATAFWSMLVWDFPFLSNDVGLLMKVVVLYPISFAGIIGFVQFIIPVMSSKVAMLGVLGGIVGAGFLALANVIGL